MMEMLGMIVYIGVIISCLMIGFTIIDKVYTAFPILDIWMNKLLGCEED